MRLRFRGDIDFVLLQAPQQPRRAEYLPPDWAFVKARDGSRTFVGPSGQRLRSGALLTTPIHVKCCKKLRCQVQWAVTVLRH